MRGFILLIFTLLLFPSAASAQTYSTQTRQANARYLPQIKTWVVQDKPNSGHIIGQDKALGPSQWSLQRIDVANAWQQKIWGQGTVIAVLDTGINIQDLAFSGRVVPGYDFINHDTIPIDDHGHGSHVASIAGAAHNAQGIKGIAPKSLIMPIKVLDHTGTSNGASAIEGVLWAVDHGADVINLSLGGSPYNPAFRAALQYAKDQGVLVFCAAGNDGAAHLITYPAAYQECISVGATTQSGKKASFSTFGYGLELVAPGDQIIANNLTSGTLRTMSGTSMAAPHVAGAAALLLSTGIGPDLVRSKLLSGARDLGRVGYDLEFGFGEVSVQGALQSDGRINPPKMSCANDNIQTIQGADVAVIINCGSWEGEMDLAWQLQSPPRHGQAAIINNVLHWKPDRSFIGKDSLNIVNAQSQSMRIHLITHPKTPLTNRISDPWNLETYRCGSLKNPCKTSWLDYQVSINHPHINNLRPIKATLVWQYHTKRGWKQWRKTQSAPTRDSLASYEISSSNKKLRRIQTRVWFRTESGNMLKLSSRWLYFR